MSWRRRVKNGYWVFFSSELFCFFFSLFSLFFFLIPSMIPKHILEDGGNWERERKGEAYMTNMILNFGRKNHFEDGGVGLGGVVFVCVFFSSYIEGNSKKKMKVKKDKHEYFWMGVFFPCDGGCDFAIWDVYGRCDLDGLGLSSERLMCIIMRVYFVKGIYLWDFRNGIILRGWVGGQTSISISISTGQAKVTHTHKGTGYHSFHLGRGHTLHFTRVHERQTYSHQGRQVGRLLDYIHGEVGKEAGKDLQSLFCWDCLALVYYSMI
ncbi:hypothetical protein QBC41DRAFT_117452 [Cercophora samala]|uniref:Uncharacterized protein n=1 Tax=Cercophora samala TaxID=330535 RepID=A0AA40DBE6_9PEZI|nr:hypothetical protein QBC41DRAFT_117452 [Cercophora samala]